MLRQPETVLCCGASVTQLGRSMDDTWAGRRTYLGAGSAEEREAAALHKLAGSDVPPAEGGHLTTNRFETWSDSELKS